MKQISFIAILFTILSIKSILYLSVIIATLWAISFRQSYKLSLKVVKSIFLFNFGISIAYLIMAIFKHTDLSYIVYINLKVFAMTYFVFWFFSKHNMIQFFSFSKELSYLLTITIAQIYSYKKTYDDFLLAYKARVIKQLHTRQKRFITKTFEFFLKKALKDSKERSLAMKSRGFF